jgi:serine/threonine-protein kinase
MRTKRLASLSTTMQPGETQSHLNPGDVLHGKYRVLHEIGAGGFGKVYAAENANLGTRVAIKVRHSTGQEDDRIWREGKAAARLRSPHIVRVFDVDRLSDGTPYMVMEFLEGQSLREYLGSHGTVAVPQAVKWILELCAALREAHAINLIHRDIKPSNVFIVEGPNVDPYIKLVDFGLAKVFSGPVEESVTESGMVVGSPAYMSPEQVRSAPLNPQTDIWSLGVVLYEMVSGLRPFHGAGSAGVLAAIAADQPTPLSEVASHAPPELGRVVAKCLRKTESERFATVDDLTAALRGLEISSGWRLANRISAIPASQEETRTSSSSGMPPSVKDPTPQRQRSGWLAAAGVLLLGGVAWLQLSWGEGRSTASSHVADGGPASTTHRQPAKAEPLTPHQEGVLTDAAGPLPSRARTPAPAMPSAAIETLAKPETLTKVTAAKRPAPSKRLESKPVPPINKPVASAAGLFVDPDF